MIIIRKLSSNRVFKNILIATLILTFVLSSSETAMAKTKKVSKKPKGHIILVQKYPKTIYATEHFRFKPKLKVKVKKGKYRYGKVKFSYSSSNKKVATVNRKGVVTGTGAGDATITIKSSNGVRRSYQIKVKGIDKLVALTFDDGPSEHTSRLLDAIKENGFHGTFFMVGCYAQNQPDVLRKMVNYGNEPAIHSWAHADYTTMSQDAVAADIESTRNTIMNYTGVSPTLVRPPYGSYNASTLEAFRQKACSCIMWNTDIEDWKYFNAVTVENNIMSRVHPGAVLVIHDSHSWSVDAIIAAMPKLKAQGYELVTVSQFAKLKGIKLTPGSKFTGTDR